MLILTPFRYPLFYFFLTLCAPNICFGQQTQSDSLLAFYQDEQLADTVRIKALIDLGESTYARNNPDSIELYFRAAGSLALEQISSEYKFLYHYLRARALFDASRYRESLSKAELAEKVAKANQDTSAQIRVLSLQSSCYRDLSDYSRAIATATDALLLADITGSKDLATLHANIGLVYGRFNDFEKARKSLYLSLKLCQAEGNQVREVAAFTNLGWIYNEEENFEKSREYHLKALAIVEEIDLRRYKGTVLLNVGDTYASLGQTELARTYTIQGITTARTENEWPAIARGAIQMAHLYRESKQDSAFHYAQEALGLAKQLGNQTIIENAVQILYQLHEDKGEYKQALAMHKLWKLTIDSIFSEENRVALYQNEAKYEYEKQKLKDELAYEQGLYVQKLRAQTRFYLLLGTMFVLAAVFFYLYKRRQIRSKQERTNLLHEMELLKQRIAGYSMVVEKVEEGMTLDKERIEAHLGIIIGESSWNILEAIYENPTVSNREIAQQVFLSIEGVSSSLRRMYSSFEVRSESRKNLKVALANKAIRLSLGRTG